MSCYNKEYFLQDFIKRTKNNLDIIDYAVKHKNEFMFPDLIGYEVTQRINSFFGFIILPFEFEASIDYDVYIEDYPKINDSMKEIKEFLLKLKKEKRFYSNYCDFDSTKIEEYGFKEIKEFIRHLRNSLSHSGRQGITFLPIGKAELKKEEEVPITNIIFCDVLNGSKKDKKQVFCLKLRVVNSNGDDSEIDKIRKLITQLFESLEDLWGRCDRKSILDEKEEMMESLLKTGDSDAFFVEWGKLFDKKSSKGVKKND